MRIPGSSNSCRATVMTAGEASHRAVRPGKADSRIPDASGASPHPMVFAGHVAERGLANVPPGVLSKHLGIPGSHNGVKGMLA